MVALLFACYTPGFPRTMELSGTLKLTKEFAFIMTLLPITVFPTISAFGAMYISFPRAGVPTIFPLYIFHIATPLLTVTYEPITVFPWMVIFPICPILKPLPIVVRGDIFRISRINPLVLFA